MGVFLSILMLFIAGFIASLVCMILCFKNKSGSKGIAHANARLEKKGWIACLITLIICFIGVLIMVYILVDDKWMHEFIQETETLIRYKYKLEHPNATYDEIRQIVGASK